MNNNKKELKMTDDLFFKHLMINSQNIRTLLCQKLIGNEVKLETTAIVNTELDIEYQNLKLHILDILAIDEHGHQYNIEMQCSPIKENNFKRFLVYGYKMITTSFKKGQDYTDLKPVYQLIINASKKDIGDFHHYEHIIELCDDKYKKIPDNYSLIHMHLIQLHHIDELGDIHLQDEFNKAMYTFKNGRENDIIDSSKVVEEMINMFDHYVIDHDTLMEINEERDTAWTNTVLHEARDEAKLETYIELYHAGDINYERLKELSKLTDEQLNERI